MRVFVLVLSFLILISCVSIAISTNNGEAHSKDPQTEKNIIIGESNGNEERREDSGTGRIGDEIDHKDEPQADYDTAG